MLSIIFPHDVPFLLTVIYLWKEIFLPPLIYIHTHSHIHNSTYYYSILITKALHVITFTRWRGCDRMLDHGVYNEVPSLCSLRQCLTQSIISEIRQMSRESELPVHAWFPLVSHRRQVCIVRGPGAPGPRRAVTGVPFLETYIPKSRSGGSQGWWAQEPRSPALPFWFGGVFLLDRELWQLPAHAGPQEKERHVLE